MNPVVFSLAVICSVGLAAVALGFLSIAHNVSSNRILEQRAKLCQARWEADLAAANEAIHGLTTHIQQIEGENQVAVPPSPRPGLNLSTRSQALRMNRRGDRPAQIAAALQVPLQEVELLLKVHEIVLQNLIPAKTEPPPAARARAAP